MRISPILMYPSYRYGKATPWGGARLREMFNKDTPGANTGESLEVSVIPGLNSRDAEGTGLSRLIERYGKALLGTEIKGDFPLLVKLIDARESLSVQVHPDDAYAKKNENKLGKSEAWIILDAKPGAKIVYGLKEGVTAEMLETAAEKGRILEELLHYEEVTKGDVFDIPAGTVHAVGEGIVLYEIQQSSDVTYRFYDWDRRDDNSNKRVLHTKQALDVAYLGRPPGKPSPLPLDLAGKGRLELLLQTPYFSTLRYSHCQEALLSPDSRRFAVLTALSDAVLHCQDRAIDLPAGQTVFLPANGEELLLTGEELLYSSPSLKQNFSS